MNCANSSLIKFLISHNFLDEAEDLSKFSNISKPLLQALAEYNLISEAKVIKAIETELQVKVFTLDLVDEVDIMRTFDLMAQVDFKRCVESHSLPVVMNSGNTNFLVTNPFDIEIVNEMRFVLSREFTVFLISGQNLNSLVCRCDPHEAQEFDELTNLEFGAQLEILNPPDEDLAGDPLPELKAPIITLVNKIIVDAITSKASDIHLEPNQWSYEVRNRIDGTLHKALEIPKRLQKAVTARIKLLSNMDIADHRKPQDGRMQLRVNGQVIDLRVSCIPTSQGECLVLRILQTDRDKLRLENLKLPKDVNKKLRRAILAEGKMLLVTGPTGSGKTTTLYSCLTELQKDMPNIVTVEDPIEYRLSGVNQMQVNELAGVTFASALRSIMRQDPDIILIGEIRDQETADIAIQAAQTGHLVLSTLHTNDAPSAITRLIDLGVEPFMISASLAGVVAQRLVRKICPNCSDQLDDSKIKGYAADETLSKYKIDFRKVRFGKGCAACRDTGYIGRVGVYSFLEITKEIQEAMQQSFSLNKIITVAETEGFIDLDLQAMKMVSEGITTIDEIRPYLVAGERVEDKQSLQSKYIGILSESDKVKDKLIETISKEKNLIPISINLGEPKVDLGVYIIDASLSSNLQTQFFTQLKMNNLAPPILVLGNLQIPELNEYMGQIEATSKGSSPLMIVNRCRQLLDNTKLGEGN